LNQHEVFDVLDDLDVLKLLLLVGGIVLDQALPLSLRLRLLVHQAVIVDLSDVVPPLTLATLALLEDVAEVEHSLERAEQFFVLRRT